MTQLEFIEQFLKITQTKICPGNIQVMMNPDCKYVEFGEVKWQ